MRYIALATDYDGTLATHGEVDASTIAALKNLLSSGRKLILVTGRELEDLQRVFPRLELFHRVVAENGALLYRPATKETRLLCESPSQPFITRLRDRGVPFSVGHCIVATWEPHEKTVLETIHEQGLELQVAFNKGAVMVLPSGMNKGSGLKVALEELGLSAHNVVGVGDAENDHAFLATCECAVAVSNALPTLQQRADAVTRRSHGAGISELIEQLLRDDLVAFDSRLHRHGILLGARCETEDEAEGAQVWLSPTRGGILIAGPSGSGKSKTTTAILERLAEQKYQYCLIDPEGDYEQLEGALVLGSTERAPQPTEALRALRNAEQNVVVNLLGVGLAERPQFFAGFLPRLQELRAATARPHVIVVDEAHQLLPSSWVPASTTMPQALEGMLLITVHPDHVAKAALRTVETVIAVGQASGETLAKFAAVTDKPAPVAPDTLPDLEKGETLVWLCAAGEPFTVRVEPPRTERKRHLRKYAEGELPPDRSFYFRGPDKKLNLRAHNVMLFAELSEGVDDATWLHHLRQGDYSHWFRTGIKDKHLAREAASIEKNTGLSPRESRAQFREIILRKYSAAA